MILGLGEKFIQVKCGIRMYHTQKQLTSLEGSIPSSSTKCTQHDTRSGVDNEVLIGIKMIPLAHQKSYVVKILAEPTDYGSMRGSIPFSGAKIK